MFKTQLDRQSTYSFDKSGVYNSVLALPDQLAQVAQIGEGIILPKTYSVVNKVIVAGVGGSALGARVIKAFGSNLLPIPLEIVTDFHLPSWADHNTLVILSSYSGNTEETLTAASDIKKQKALPVVLTSGGKLAQMATDFGWPLVLFEPLHNPSSQPRMALGYNLGLLLMILSAAKLVDSSAEELKLGEEILRLHQTRLSKEVPQKENSAKLLADKLTGRAAVLIAAEHLYGAAYTFKNQLNENAKNFSCLFGLPELVHHFLEGLGHPKDLPRHTHFVLFDSGLYSPDIARRLMLTEEIITKQGFGVTRIKAEAPRSLGQVLETIQFGAFVSLYLALSNKLDPGPIPWVDYFKTKLS